MFERYLRACEEAAKAERVARFWPFPTIDEDAARKVRYRTYLATYLPDEQRSADDRELIARMGGRAQ